MNFGKPVMLRSVGKFKADCVLLASKNTVMWQRYTLYCVQSSWPSCFGFRQLLHRDYLLCLPC